MIAHDCGKKLRPGRRVERAERDRGCVLGLRPGRSELGPVRYDHESRKPRNPIGQHRQEVQRRGVGPMRVFHQDQDRPVVGHPHQPPRQDPVDPPRASRGVVLHARFGVDSEEIMDKGRVFG